MGRCLFLVLLLIDLAVAQRPHLQTLSDPGKTSAATPPQKWQTLSGASPVVIARGGFSGVFPESTKASYDLAESESLSNVLLFCDLQLTKDGKGICQTALNLDNTTDIAELYPKGVKTYNVNGKDVNGWFALDFPADPLLTKVFSAQNVYSRPSLFDGSLPLLEVDDVIGFKPGQFWLNVQYDMFYTQHNLNVASYIQGLTRKGVINYLSSPEIGFLKSIGGKVNKGKTKLIFRFLDKDAVEPTTKQKYGSILEDLSSIKPFVSGILVPKNYIWPVNDNLYLEAPTSLVTDAHKQRLEVYASGFANDVIGSYNYSFDPTAEYLQFIDNSVFSVDGVLTDFPATASEAIACFAQNKQQDKPTKGKVLIITHNGASGIYPGCTDLAYQKAIDDGADIIDCSVQMSKDGVLFCLDSADLTKNSNALTSFMSRATTIPEIQSEKGIFSFDFTWNEILSLKPQLFSPQGDARLVRNPAYKDKGKFFMLSDFLEIAKAKAVSGILVNIENAAFLASKKGLDITDAVAKALSNATFDKQATQQVWIQSDDSAVLSAFKNVTSYKKVLYFKNATSAVPKPVAEQIKKVADAVNLPKRSFIQSSFDFVSAYTHVVSDLHAFNISVYVSHLRNEFSAVAIDFYSDPMIEMATYISKIGVDGMVTEYPGTASKFLRSPCSDPNADIPYTIVPPNAGDFLALASADELPPAESPAPPLDVADVTDPPLPPVAVISTKAPATAPAAATTPTTKSSQIANTANVGLGLVSIMVLNVFCL